MKVMGFASFESKVFHCESTGKKKAIEIETKGK